MSLLTSLRRHAPEQRSAVVPAPRVSDEVLEAVLDRDRRRQQVPYDGPDRRAPRD